MKELTIEQKAKRYDEITEKFDVILNLDVIKESGTVPVNDVRKIIPEIKESDEKIREEIINYFECQSRDEPCRKSIHDKWICWLKKQAKETNRKPLEDDVRRRSTIQVLEYARSLNTYNQYGKADIDKNIAWLEKQGQTFTKKDVDDAYLAGVRDAKKELEKQSERNSDCSDEDERIRKTLTNGFNKLDKSALWYNGITNGQILAWLEKQSEQKPVDKVETKDYNSIDPHFGKPTDKVEPKFHEGDWVIQDNVGIYKVIEVCESWYEVVDDKDKHYSIDFDKEYMCYLWTIADAKDGDVLVDVYGNIGIYNSHDDFSWLSYCSLGYYGGFQHFTIEHDNEKTYPATKEQRDTLMKAIADAGYEFDFERKELKNIEL